MNMKNKTPILPEDMEKRLERYYSAPEPSPEFTARLDHELRSKLRRQETQKMFGRKSRLSPRLAWGLGVIFVTLLVSLVAASPTLVAAMRRLLGYIPGVGVVEQGAPMRVLAEPVSQTRDGITITVTEAVLGIDKTIIVFTVDNIPWEMLSHEEGIPGCYAEAEVQLSDGTKFQSGSGGGNGWGSGYERRFTYPPVPADVNEANLLVSCIQGSLPGTLPENWTLHLRFVPAPPEMTVFPVQEWTPAPATANTEAAENTQIIISNVIDTGNSFILSGTFNPPAPEGAADWSVQPNFPGLVLTDSTGQEIPYEYPEDIELPMVADMHVESWAVEINKNFVAPLTINYSTTYVLRDAQTSYAFEFDAGPNPQVGQTWALNKEIQMAGHVFVLGSIKMEPGHSGDIGYEFEFFSVDGSVLGVNVDIEGYASQGGGGGGGGGSSEQVSSFGTSLYYAQPPTGRLNIVLYNLQVRGETKTWKLDWTPDSPQGEFPPQSIAPDACLTLATVQQALANPQPLPEALTGKLIVYGRIVEDGQDPSPENYGVFVVRTDGSDRQVLGPGVWPSLSKDGTRAAYAWNDGLYITDLASGQSYLIPDTKPNDYNPRWSPDGSRIAFVRVDDVNLYIVGPDGSGVQKITDANDYEQLIDWSADGESLYFGVLSPNGYLLKKTNLTTGVVQDLFSIQSKGLSAAISPDENWIAAVGKFADDPQFGLFLSRMDGSERRLLAQLNHHWGVSNPIWSADGQWLLLTITNLEQTSTEETPIVLNVNTCQVFPIPIHGSVQDWEE